ncbi:inner membrane protein [Tenacibaculum adriaticum]|uniref:Inner membrane protein n=1 Tax=Tenacibaculum adriaticum TaxID=413713 RepID=A0A5S5DXU1_9FLAO|nr:metal-dependent hydrolase [Tenacibaculum adriaticum]TYP99866.1 inner membrane protein [Tenacibaculum adriaticum]
MASIFGHAITAIALGKSFSKTMISYKFWILGVLCSILPDADVIGFSFDIKYHSFWGHRGFSHSILFAFILGGLVTVLFYRKQTFSFNGGLYILFFTLCTASHGILDALTTGGLGVAFFSPFNNTRYFFPWRPIQVSPIGVERFFGERGLKVISSELIWIGIPSILYIAVAIFFKRSNRRINGKQSH